VLIDKHRLKKKLKGDMTMKKNLGLNILIVLLLVFTLTAAAAAQEQDILEKVIANKKVRVGILADYAPWGYRNAQGQYEGFDVDVANRLGEALEVDVDLVPVESAARVGSLVSEKVDVIIACLTPTDGRAKTINFTIPYASNGLTIMVWADNKDIKSYHDLAGKTIAIVRGGTADMYLPELVPEANIVRLDSIADSVVAFKSKKSDALVEEELMVYYEVDKDSRFKVVGEPFKSGLISFGVKKHEQEWLNYLNNFLTNLRFSGELDVFYEKWFKHKPASLAID